MTDTWTLVETVDVPDTLALVKQLQLQGCHVRIVNQDARNLVYVDGGE